VVVPPAGRVRSAGFAAKGSIRVTVGCPAGGSCSGSLTVAKRRLVLGRASYTLTAGQRKKLRVKLSAKAVRLVRRAGKVRVRVTAVTRNGGGAQVTKSWSRPLEG
jgi:ribosomal protein L28